ncbi:hypothetical protein QZH41_018082, partial [Actinostola sp. cb2023]
MADGKDPSNVIKKARLIEDGEFQQFCNKLLGVLQGNDRGTECISQLRKFFLLIAATRRKKRIATNVIEGLQIVVSEPQQGSKKLKLLCSAILREMAPTVQLVISSVDPPVDQQSIPILLPLALTQGKELGYWSNHVPVMIKWITSGGIPVQLQTTALGCLNNCFFSYPEIVSPDDVGLICHQMSHWLRHARTVSAPNPYQRQMFSGRKKGYQAVTEIDGSMSRFFFTILSIGPAKVQDSILVEASLVEAVLILDVLCKCDKSLVPKLIEIVRRVYGQVTSDMSKWKRAVLPVVQFLLNHGESVVFDPEPACKVLFGTMVNAFYLSSSFSFEVVMFCLDNMEKLCTSTSVFTKFFPNLFKVLAWSPRTFLREFLELLPVMMSEDSVVEVFHSILDLPCLSAALCAAWASRGNASAEYWNSSRICAGKTFSTTVHYLFIVYLSGKMGSNDVSSSLPPSITAYLDPKHRPLFSFILRPEAGHGDTISRLKALHSILEDMADHPRVIVSSQITPALVNLYFTTLLEEAEIDTVSKLIPVILERSVLLFASQTYKLDIRSPKCTMGDVNGVSERSQQYGLWGFSQTLSSQYGASIFSSVWSIGEFASMAYEGGCTVQTIVQYFEKTPCLIFQVVFSGKLVSVFMTALAKLASRCQDLIQRAIMCCSKVVRQKPEMLSDTDCYNNLVTRAQELIQLLKLPNVAPVILCPDVEWITG